MIEQVLSRGMFRAKPLEERAFPGEIQCGVVGDGISCSACLRRMRKRIRLTPPGVHGSSNDGGR